MDWKDELMARAQAMQSGMPSWAEQAYANANKLALSNPMLQQFKMGGYQDALSKRADAAAKQFMNSQNQYRVNNAQRANNAFADLYNAQMGQQAGRQSIDVNSDLYKQLQPLIGDKVQNNLFGSFVDENDLNAALSQYSTIGQQELDFMKNLGLDLNPLAAGDSYYLKTSELENMLSPYASMGADDYAKWQNILSADGMNPLGEINGAYYFNKSPLEELMGNYRTINIDSLGDDPLSQLVRSKAQEFGDEYLLKNQYADYFQGIGNSLQNSKIGYYGADSFADPDLMFGLSTSNFGNSKYPDFQLFNEAGKGTGYVYVPYEAATRVLGAKDTAWIDNQRVTYTDLLNEDLFDKPVAYLPEYMQDSVKSYVDKYWQGIDDPNLGWLVKGSEYWPSVGGILNGDPSYGYYDAVTDPYGATINTGHGTHSEDNLIGSHYFRASDIVPKMQGQLGTQEALNELAKRTDGGVGALDWIAPSAKDPALFAGVGIDGYGRGDGASAAYDIYMKEKGGLLGSLGKIIRPIAPILSFINPAFGLGYNVTTGLLSGNPLQAIGSLLGSPASPFGNVMGDITSGLSDAIKPIFGDASNLVGSGLLSGTTTALGGGDFLNGALYGAGNYGIGDFVKGLDLDPITSGALYGGTTGLYKSMFQETDPSRNLLYGLLSGTAKPLFNELRN